MHATQAIAGYVTAVEDMSARDREEILEAARKYNASLEDGVNFVLSDEAYAEYEKLLDITGTGVMGYVQISSIGVNLPIYHSVEESVLQIAVGHIPGSSLPVGGEDTHTVISAHRGADAQHPVRPQGAAQCEAVFGLGPDGGGGHFHNQHHGSDHYLYGRPDTYRAAGGNGRFGHRAWKGLLYPGHLHALWSEYP